MFKIVTRTNIFIAGVLAGIVNTSVITYILLDNEKLNHKRNIAKLSEKTILPTQMR
jgi:hypothetical protein